MGCDGIGQLRDLGFSDDRVALLVAQGRLQRRHRGVYADALQQPTERGRLRGALLALGNTAPMPLGHTAALSPDEDTAFLSRRTALALHGVRLVNLRAIEVTVIAAHTPRHRGLVVHRIDTVIARRAGLRGVIRLRAALTRYRPPSTDHAMLDLHSARS